MRLSEHADHTEKTVGVRAEDIHKWIDGFFDPTGFRQFLITGKANGYDPYGHRKHRHCVEALEEAYEEFEGKYTREQIRGVFETHLKDDYHGYLPVQQDFTDGKFREKYHETGEDKIAERILSKAELNEYFKGKHYAAQKSAKRTAPRFGFWIGIALPTIIAILLLVISVFALVLPQFRQNMINQKKIMIKELTVSAASIIEHYADQVESGQLSLSQAQAEAAEDISALRYGSENKDYFWITDMQPKMVMHPYRPDLVGKDLSNYTDEENKSGKRLFVEFVKLVEENNEGYLEYYWQWMDDSTRKALKLSYVRGVPEWQWIIGTGIYINDVEREIQKLSRRILGTFALITAGLILVLLYMIRQSVRIEKDRQKAESGLVEAKERYRTLVEASNEAYIMELEGEHVYSNRTFQRWLGYDENEALNRDIWDQILPDNKANKTARNNLMAVFMGKTVRDEFEASICKRNGESQNVIISVSRIFFSQKNGHVVSIRPIVRDKSPVPSMNTDVVSFLDAEFPALLRTIEACANEGQLIRALNRLPAMIGSRLEKDHPIDQIQRELSRIYHATVRRHIELDLMDKGPTPVCFAFVSLGSAARCEMTLFSDQDNALIFESCPPDDLEKHRAFFLHVANRVCARLDQAGYPFCHGGIIAANPKWCLSIDEWKANVTSQFKNATPESIREVNIFLDMFHLYGQDQLSHRLQEHIFDQSEQFPIFFNCFAHNCLQYKLPINLLGQLKTEQIDGVNSLNIKDCLTLLVLFARIYALKHRIKPLRTTDRFTEMLNKRLINEKEHDELTNMFHYFWRLRFNNQMRQHNNLKKVTDSLDIDELSDQEKQTIRAMLSSLSVYQSKISYDFMGVDPSLSQ